MPIKRCSYCERAISSARAAPGVNVGVGSDPAFDRTILVALGGCPAEMPPVFAIDAAQAEFDFVAFPRSPATTRAPDEGWRKFTRANSSVSNGERTRFQSDGTVTGRPWCVGDHEHCGDEYSDASRVRHARWDIRSS